MCSMAGPSQRKGSSCGVEKRTPAQNCCTFLYCFLLLYQKILYFLKEMSIPKEIRKKI